MAAGDIKAGGAVVTLGVDLSPLNRGLKVASKKLNSWGRNLVGLGSGLSALGVSITAPLAAAAKAFADAGSTLNDMKARTGLSAQALSELGYAAKLSGSSLDGLEGGLKAMAKNMAKVAQGKVPAVFQALSIDAKKLMALKPEDQFLTIADAISKVQDPTLQAGLAMQAFGKAGTSLLPMIKAGASGIAAMRKDAQDLGISMSDLDASDADDLGDAMDRLRSALGGSVVKIGSSLGPILTNVLNSISNIVGYANRWIAANKQLLATIAMVGVGITVVGTALVGAGIAAMFIASSMTAILTIASVLASPFVLASAAIGGLAAALLYATGMMGILWNVGKQVFSRLSDGWKAFANAISSGNVEAAFKVITTGIQLAWETLKVELEIGWKYTTNAMFNAWSDFTADFARLGIKAFYGIADVLTDIGANLKSGWRSITDSITLTVIDAMDSLEKFMHRMSIDPTGNKSAAVRKELLAQGADPAEVDAEIKKRLDGPGHALAQEMRAGIEAEQKQRSDPMQDAKSKKSERKKEMDNLLAGIKPEQRNSVGYDNSGVRSAQEAYDAAIESAQNSTEGAAARSKGLGLHGFNLQSSMDSKSESVGTFNSAAVGRIGASSLADQQYDLTKRMLSTMQSVDLTLKDMDDDQ